MSPPVIFSQLSFTFCFIVVGTREPSGCCHPENISTSGSSRGCHCDFGFDLVFFFFLPDLLKMFGHATVEVSPVFARHSHSLTSVCSSIIHSHGSDWGRQVCVCVFVFRLECILVPLWDGTGVCEKGRVSAVMQTQSDGGGCEAQNILFMWRRSSQNLQSITEGTVSSAETPLMHSCSDDDAEGKFLEYCSEEQGWCLVNKTVGL